MLLMEREAETDRLIDGVSLRDMSVCLPEAATLILVKRAHNSRALLTCSHAVAAVVVDVCPIFFFLFFASISPDFHLQSSLTFLPSFLHHFIAPCLPMRFMSCFFLLSFFSFSTLIIVTGKK